MKRLIFLCFYFIVLGLSAQTKTENVFIITLDGYRWQELFSGADPSLIDDKEFTRNPEMMRASFWDEDPLVRRKMLMPFFWGKIAKEGQLYGNRNIGSKVNCSNNMWFSYPGYSEILCGFADDERINSNDKIANPNKTVLEFLNNRKELNGKIAAFGSWDVFPFIINEERSGIPVNAGYEEMNDPANEQVDLINKMQAEIPRRWGGVRFDAFTHHFAKQYIKKYKPRVVYISYGETDDFAHEGEYDEYLKSAHQTDAFIEDLWNFLQQDPQYRAKTTFIISTDHGRGTDPKESWKSHGTSIYNAGEIWIAVIGPDTPASGEISEGQYFQSQIAKTAAALLNVEYTNEHEVGEVISAVLQNR